MDKCSTRVLAKCKKRVVEASMSNVMVKSLPPTNVGTLWRDGRAAEGACLENMFGESQRGFESHSLRQTILDLRFWISDCQSKIVNLKSKIELGRCQSGRMGPPAKRLPGRNPRSQVRILSSPPLKNALGRERVFLSVVRPP